MRIVVLRAGDVAAEVATTRGEYPRLIEETVGAAWTGAWDAVDVRTESLPDPGSAAAFIMTGSSASVTERTPWMLRTEAYLRDIIEAKVPLFGICFGHQMIAQALGGEVGPNPLGREIGTVPLRKLAVDEILEGLPAEFFVNTTHVDTVLRLPAGARVLASTVKEKVAAFAIGDHVRAVQFHPELDDDAMRGYVRARAEVIVKDGLDPQAIFAAVRPSPENGAVLRNFVARLVPRGPAR